MKTSADEVLIVRRPQFESLSLEEVSQSIVTDVPSHRVGCVNWPEEFPYCPDVTFRIAHTGSAFYVHFAVCGEDLRAVNTEPLSAVAQDSCVEFFMQLPDDAAYWNFEFNCIGTVNASHRVERSNPVRLTVDEIATIGRNASCGTAPFEERSGIHRWTLTVRIPFDLVGIDKSNIPSHIKANVYKCGSKTSHPHYVSWAPIDSTHPDFHVKSSFAQMSLE